MNAILLKFEQMTLDQKKYLIVSALVLGLLMVYALSKVTTPAEIVIEETKTSDFRAGNLTVDETPDFYRRKDEMQRKQQEEILSNQKAFEERLAENGQAPRGGQAN